MSPGEPRPGPKGAGAAAARAYAPHAPGPDARRSLDVEADTFGDGPGQAAPAGDGGGAGDGPLTDEMRAMVEECLPLVKFIAHRMAGRLPKSVEVDDLVGDGVMGLLSAAQHFDPSRGAKFKTFAEPRIRGAILDSLRSLDWAPRSLRQKQKDIEDAYHEISMRNGRAAEDEEVAERLGVPLGDLHRSLDDLKGITLGSFEDASGEGEGVLAYVADPDAEDPHAALHEKEMRALVAATIEGLPDKERLVVQLYWHDELSMREIGSALGITESRVSQLHTKAMLRLRGRLRRMSAA